jgi:2-oxoglutarate ferredoxin oxidoreductase subunit alpha
MQWRRFDTQRRLHVMDNTIRIGGKAGQGLQSIGGMLARVFSRLGFHVFSHQDYMSRVRGGHNFYQVRFSNQEIMASKEKVDILVALDLNTIEIHGKSLDPQGMVVYDAEMTKKSFDDPAYLNVPFEKIAVEKGGSKIVSNTVATGAVFGMLGMELGIYEEVIKETFKKKGEEVVSKNISAAMAGFEYAVKECLRCSFTVPQKGAHQLMLLNGNQAIGLGAVMSGCKFYSAYPMTPSTGVMIFLASRAKECGIMVEQAEDEIAAINMALGGSFAGVRAMTGSSGGGFALMVEGLSLAAMTETPIVIAEVQRPGPATGLPTRTEQGDLLFVLHSGHGEFPRVVFAPGTPEQAFYLTNKAFDLAEKYQIPAFVMSDQYLSDSQWTYKSLYPDKLHYTDYRLRGKAFESLTGYRRHAITKDGVSPLGVPGESRHVVVTDSDEHDEEGHIIEDAETRNAMVRKRVLDTLPRIRQEMSPPFLYGEKRPEIVLCGWGSTYGPIKEVVDVLSKDRSVAMLHFSEIYPFPSTEEYNYLEVLGRSKRAICIENNATGQFAHHIRAELGYRFSNTINKYDGRPFMVETLVEEIDAQLGHL